MQFTDDPGGEIQREASGAFAVLRNRAQDFFFQLRTHTRCGAQFLFFADAFQIVDRADPKVLYQRADTFRSKTLNLEHFQGGRGVLCEHLVAAFEGSTLLESRGAPQRCPCRFRECR